MLIVIDHLLNIIVLMQHETTHLLLLVKNKKNKNKQNKNREEKWGLGQRWKTFGEQNL